MSMCNANVENYVKKITCLRYLGISSIITYKVLIKMLKNKQYIINNNNLYENLNDSNTEYHNISHNTSHNLYNFKLLIDNGYINFIILFSKSVILFLTSEGICIALYFATTASVDNLTIYFIPIKYCISEMALSVYLGSLFSFYPTYFLASKIQNTFYEKGNKPEQVFFIITIIMITLLFFCFRMMIIYKSHFIDLMTNVHKLPDIIQIILVSVIPIIVDMIQTYILSSTITHNNNDNNNNDNYITIIHIQDIEAKINKIENIIAYYEKQNENLKSHNYNNITDFVWHNELNRNLFIIDHLNIKLNRLRIKHSILIDIENQ
jgi:hypothetical protein